MSIHQLILTPQFPVNSKDIVQTWKKLRFQKIDQILLLVDRQGSMASFHDFVDELCTAIKQACNSRNIILYYFHDVPAEGANELLLMKLNELFPTLDSIMPDIKPLHEGLIYEDPDLFFPKDLKCVLDDYAKEAAVILLSDAGAARGNYDPLRLLDTVAFWKGLRQYTKQSVWLNPVPQTGWKYTTAEQIARYFPMFYLNLDGMKQAIHVLQGWPHNRQVQNFDQRFTSDEKIINFAYNAALPVALTPKLLHLIRINCPELRPLPLIAEFDLLQSSLCQPIDNNHYKIKEKIRNDLLVGLSEKFDKKRHRLLANLLRKYALQESLWKEYPELKEAQRMSALSILDPDKCRQSFDVMKRNHVQSDGWCDAVQQEISCNTRIFRNNNSVPSGNGKAPPDNVTLKPVIIETSTFDGIKNWILEVVTMSYEEDLGDDAKLQMVRIPGGNFLMGAPEEEKGSYASEYPQHTVTIAPFYMSRYPVTQEQWRAVAALPEIDHQLEPDPSFFKGKRRPVESIRRQDIEEFLKRLRKHTNRAYRLPTEAEWEYACRARTNTPFYFGRTITPDLANYRNRETEEAEETTEVDKFQPNAFGLYDMHGNVWEWCSDEWHENYIGAPSDGRSWTTSSEKKYQVLRGGSWSHPQQDLRCACRRLRRIPLINQRGFRLARSVR
jgi:formylglycine-generating enzyme required for sulfatase activity